MYSINPNVGWNGGEDTRQTAVKKVSLLRLVSNKWGEKPVMTAIPPLGAMVTKGEAQMMNISSAVGEDYEARYMVVDGTNSPISRVSCVHICSEIVWTNETAASLLNPGELSPVQILRARR